MYRSRIENTKTKSKESQRLQNAMLAYHDYQQSQLPVNDNQLGILSNWQTQRLHGTHRDLYEQEEYRVGLDFLFTDLYSSTDFSDRDRDLERIFPKMIKLLPKSVLDTVAVLVELNLLTQKLDVELADILFNELKVETVTQDLYSEAYRRSAAYDARVNQLTLIKEAGKKLNKYARSNTIEFALKLSEGAAEMAGLGALHNFIQRGFAAFHSMRDVDSLLTKLTTREKEILDRIFGNHPSPFGGDT